MVSLRIERDPAGGDDFLLEAAQWWLPEPPVPPWSCVITKPRTEHGQREANSPSNILAGLLRATSRHCARRISLSGNPLPRSGGCTRRRSLTLSPPLRLTAIGGRRAPGQQSECACTVVGSTEHGGEDHNNDEHCFEQAQRDGNGRAVQPESRVQ